MHVTTQKSTLITACFLLLACFISTMGYAQAVTKPAPFKLKLGLVDIYSAKTGTVDQVLASPQLLFEDQSYVVESFTLSFQPHGKDYIGPFVTMGAKLTDKEIDIFKQLKADGISRTKVFFEDIKAHGPDGQTRSLSPVIFTLVQQ